MRGDPIKIFRCAAEATAKEMAHAGHDLDAIAAGIRTLGDSYFDLIASAAPEHVTVQ